MSQLNSLGRLVGLSLLLLVYKSWCVSCFSWLVFTAPIDVLLSRSLQFPYISGLHTNTVHMLYSSFFLFFHSLTPPPPFTSSPHFRLHCYFIVYTRRTVCNHLFCMLSTKKISFVVRAAMNLYATLTPPLNALVLVWPSCVW